MVPTMTAIPQAASAWIEEEVGAPVVTAIELAGATTASVHRIDLADGRTLVTKRFDRQDFLDERPDRAAHEAAVLELLEPTPVPAPLLVAVDPSGSGAGVPTVLMSWIDGSPQPPNRWVDAVAANLAALHEVAPGAITWSYERYNADAELVVPSWASDPAAWEDAFTIAEGAPPVETSFIHRDYHGGNLLWSGSRLAGVLDWLSGCIGPPAIDLAHLRINLAMDVDTEAADAVLTAYVARRGRDAWHPAWEVVDLIDFLPYWLGPAAVEGWAWDHRPMQDTQGRFDRVLTEAVRSAERFHG